MDQKLQPTPEDWINGLANFLMNRTDVEAILLHEKGKTISIGSMTPSIDEKNFERCLHETIDAIENNVLKGQKISLPAGLKIKTIPKGTLIEKAQTAEFSKEFHWREFPWPEPKVTKKPAVREADWRFLSALAIICGIFALSGFIISKLHIAPPWVPILLYIIAMIAGGWDTFQDVHKKLPQGQLDIDFLMLAVVLGAAAIAAWAEGALLFFLFSASGALEKIVNYRTRKAIDQLFAAAPETATIIDQMGQEKIIPIQDVVPDQIVVVKPGQLFPVDGEIILGKTSVDESTITGEALPADKTVGDLVSSGTMNLWGVVQTKVLRAAKESSLQKIINLIEQAQHLKAPVQRFTDRFGTPYTYLILSITIIMFFVWWLGLNVHPFKNIEGSYSAFYRSMTLLVVASPCALVLSIPSAILAAIAWGASHGILFRGGAAIEKLSEINIVALDKTGTLTKGDLEVISVESFPKGREKEVEKLAYSLEKNSTHPIARAIAQYSRYKKINSREVKEFRSLTGLGVQGLVDGELCIVGKRSLLELGPLAPWSKQLPEEAEKFTEIWVVYDNLIGRILLQDTIREESKPVLEEISKMGIKSVMLTGDRRGAAEAVGKELGIQEVKYGLKPEDKVCLIQEWQAQGNKVAMVGDGVNDAPSLATAYVSVAMGTRGSDAALEQSEVILMNDRIDYFLQAYRLSLKAKRVIQINLSISLASIIIMVIGSLFGIVPLTLGVITHEGSTLLVCLNSLCLLYLKIFKK